MMSPELRVRLILWFSQSWPIRVFSWWLEKSVPEREGFGRFRARVLVFDIENLEESTHVLYRGDSRYFIQPNGTPADAWWQEEIRMLRMLESQTMHAEAVTRLRNEADERNKTRLVTVVVVGTLAVLSVALYAMRYLK